MYSEMLSMAAAITRFLGHGCQVSEDDLKTINGAGYAPIELFHKLMALKGAVNNWSSDIQGIECWDWHEAWKSSLEWTTYGNRLKLAFTNTSIIIEAWAGPAEGREAAIAASVKYTEVTDDQGDFISFGVEESFINPELVVGREDRILLLYQIDEKCGNGMLRQYIQSGELKDFSAAFLAVEVLLSQTKVSLAEKFAAQGKGWRRVKKEDVVEEEQTDTNPTSSWPPNSEDMIEEDEDDIQPEKYIEVPKNFGVLGEDD